jgi:predicted nucleic acid-binding protein
LRVDLPRLATLCLHDVVHGSFPILPYDEAAAACHVEERARLEAPGRPASSVDGQIAAIAHMHGLVLATTSDKDFARFKGLTVENWLKRHVRTKTEYHFLDPQV